MLAWYVKIGNLIALFLVIVKIETIRMDHSKIKKTLYYEINIRKKSLTEQHLNYI